MADNKYLLTRANDTLPYCTVTQSKKAHAPNFCVCDPTDTVLDLGAYELDR